MTIASEYFPGSDETPSHPRVLRWTRALEQPGAAGWVEVHQAQGLLGPEPAVLYVTIEGPTVNIQDSEPWSEEIHHALVGLGIRGRSEEHDVARFALALRGAFEPTEIDVGEGFFNAVLVRHLKASSVAAELAGILNKIHTGDPSGSIRLADCEQRVRGAIRDQGRDLLKLGWPSPVAARILVAALARYLDERFYVSTREALSFQAMRAGLDQSKR